MATTTDLAEKASHILARERIPFHAIPMHWLTTLDIFKLSMIAVAAYICHKQQNERLAFVLIISLVLGIAITVIVGFLDDDRILLLFPWRVSAILAPIALILLVATALNRFAKAWIYNHQKFVLIPIILLAGLVQFMKVYGGYPGSAPVFWIEAALTSGVYRTKIQDRLDRMEVINWAKTHDSADLYLVPLDFEQFRIKSGRPIFIDWESHPFKDVEVIEWKRRIEVAQKAFENLRECRKIYSDEFNIVIVDNSSVAYKGNPTCTLYNETQINSRFSFVKLS
jgi:hypothetical protein